MSIWLEEALVYSIIAAALVFLIRRFTVSDGCASQCAGACSSTNDASKLVSLRKK